MKKLLALIVFAALVCAGIQAQSATVIKKKMPAVTVKGTGTGYTIFPILAGEYDVSIQMIPAVYGVGTHVSFSHVLYLSDSYSDDVWSAVSSADTVSTVTDSDAIAYWSDLKPVRIKAIYTGLTTDTITVTPYFVAKKHANE